jgi:hypothetical protein
MEGCDKRKDVARASEIFTLFLDASIQLLFFCGGCVRWEKFVFCCCFSPTYDVCVLWQENKKKNWRIQNILKKFKIFIELNENKFQTQRMSQAACSKIPHLIPASSKSENNAQPSWKIKVVWIFPPFSLTSCDNNRNYLITWRRKSWWTFFLFLVLFWIFTFRA